MPKHKHAMGTVVEAVYRRNRLSLTGHDKHGAYYYHIGKALNRSVTRIDPKTGNWHHMTTFAAKKERARL